MVTRMRSKLIMLDVVGGAAVLGLLLCAGWLAFLRDHGGIREIDELIVGITKSRARLSELGSRITVREAELARLEEAADTTGRLPQRIPVDEDLLAIDALARTHDVDVTRLLPIASVTYEGLKEHRYSLEAAGETANLMAFLRAIEQAEFWADVGYLKISAVPTKRGEPTRERIASLTISMFLSLPPEAETSEKKG